MKTLVLILAMIVSSGASAATEQLAHLDINQNRSYWMTSDSKKSNCVVFKRRGANYHQFKGTATIGSHQEEFKLEQSRAVLFARVCEVKRISDGTVTYLLTASGLEAEVRFERGSFLDLKKFLPVRLEPIQSSGAYFKNLEIMARFQNLVHERSSHEGVQAGDSTPAIYLPHDPQVTIENIRVDRRGVLAFDYSFSYSMRFLPK